MSLNPEPCFPAESLGPERLLQSLNRHMVPSSSCSTVWNHPTRLRSSPFTVAGATAAFVKRAAMLIWVSPMHWTLGSCILTLAVDPFSKRSQSFHDDEAVFSQNPVVFWEITNKWTQQSKKQVTARYINNILKNTSEKSTEHLPHKYLYFQILKSRK